MIPLENIELLSIILVENSFFSDTYSYLPNKRGVPNKRGQWNFSKIKKTGSNKMYLIKGETGKFSEIE